MGILLAKQIVQFLQRPLFQNNFPCSAWPLNDSLNAGRNIYCSNTRDVSNVRDFKDDFASDHDRETMKLELLVVKTGETGKRGLTGPKAFKLFHRMIEIHQIRIFNTD